MKVSFLKLEEQRVKDNFLSVLERFEALHPYEIVLRQASIPTSTMQAQPIISLANLFQESSSYQVKIAINVKDSENIRVAELPDEVLAGYFAHELGHIVDYLPYTNLQMVGYGIKYLASGRFKRKAEHAADHIAIQNGFHEEILATKKFLLENDLLKESYKAKIRKYYMSIEDVKLCVCGKLPFLATY